MEHGNYGNCIRQVLGRSSPQKHLKRREEYVSGLNGLLSSSDEVSSSVTGISWWNLLAAFMPFVSFQLLLDSQRRYI